MGKKVRRKIERWGDLGIGREVGRSEVCSEVGTEVRRSR